MRVRPVSLGELVGNRENCLSNQPQCVWAVPPLLCQLLLGSMVFEKTKFLLADRQRGSSPVALPKMSGTQQRWQREERVCLARSWAAAAWRYKWQP